VAVGVAEVLGSEVPFAAAHLLRWASAMALRPAALTFRRAGFSGAGIEAGSAGSPERQPTASRLHSYLVRHRHAARRVSSAENRTDR
jgi:hypothetical protein